MKNFKKLILLLASLGVGKAHAETSESASEIQTNFENTEPAELAPAPKLRAQSTFVRPAIIRENPFFLLKMAMSFHPGIDEFRRDPNLIGAFDPEPSAPQTVTLNETQFDAQFLLYKDHENPDLGAEFMASLPLRTLSNIDESSKMPQGSEFSGYEIGFTGRPISSLNFQLTYADRNSPHLRLFDRHREISAGVFFQSVESAFAGIKLGMLTGPLFNRSFAVPNNDGITARYGPSLGVKARLDLETYGSASTHFKVSLDSEFRRILSYAIDNIEQGGAGVLSLSPSVGYEVMNNVWVTLRVDLPVIRPVGRESTFGNTNIAGLFGKALRFEIEALTF